VKWGGAFLPREERIMCYFQSNKIEIYPEDTRIHLDYQEIDEPDQHWRKRAKLEKARRDDLNRIRNAWKMVEKVPAAERKAAERGNGYEA
jgi:hypothetical protein